MQNLPYPRLARFALVAALFTLGQYASAQSVGSSRFASERVATRFGSNRVTVTISGGERIISANGLPDHEPGIFPRRGNPNSISEQNYSFHVPTQPKAVAQPIPLRHALFGVALNGIPFDPGTAEYWNNDRASGWNYEAKSGFINLGLDEHNAHVQPTGAYHYHALPAGLVRRLGSDGQKMLLIGYAADGFPIYTSYGYAQATDSASSLKVMHSSYRLKKGVRAGGPGGSYDGKFTADYEYVSGSGDLDECNGRFGVTPEFPQGIYHYCLTGEFPWVPRFWRSTPDPTFLKRSPDRGPAPRL